MGRLALVEIALIGLLSACQAARHKVVPGESAGREAASGAESAQHLPSPSEGEPGPNPVAGVGARGFPSESGTIADPGSRPPTRREDVVDTLHGVAVADPYRWLERAEEAEVGAWMEAQDAAARDWLTRLPHRDALRRRFAELLAIEWVSSPVLQSGRWFTLRRLPDQEKAVLYWKDGEKGTERVLLDPGALSVERNISLGVWVPSPDGKYLAYTLRENNADAATLRALRVDTGEDLPGEVIAGARYARPSWLPDSRGFTYTWHPTDPAVPATELPGRAELRYHALGTDPADDPVVHPATGDPTKYLGGEVSRDGRHLVVSISRGWAATDVYFKRLGEDPALSLGRAAAAGPGGRGGEGAQHGGDEESFATLVSGIDATYEVTAWSGALYVRTNEGAPLYRVFRVDPARPDRSEWREIVPEADAPLDEMRVVGNRLVLTYLRRATSQLEVRDLEGSAARRVELPGLGTTGNMTGEPDQAEAFLRYDSYTETPHILRLRVSEAKTELWERIAYPADTSKFTTDQVFYESKDGTRISMFLLRRKEMRRDGRNPTILTGYGGFNLSQTPRFSASFIVWLERGGVIAIPNLRGGGEYGEDWHRAGMLDKKQNVFDDFIAAAEHLVAEKITRPERLAISGGSNGGLLVGAAMVQRPDLFRAVICSAPLVDMVRYHLFGSGPLWVPEYGSADDPEQFRAIYAYSPYHRVRSGTAYPALLVLSPEADDRVDTFHARKFTAAVQAASSSSRPVLLRVERRAGHGGPDIISSSVERLADTYAFLLDQLGPR